MLNPRMVLHKPIAQFATVAIIVAGTGAAATGQAVLGNSSVHIQDSLRVTSVRNENGRGGVGIVNEDGTYFLAGAEMYPGETYQIHIGLDNLSGEVTTSLLRVDAPAGFTVQVSLPAAFARGNAIVHAERNRWVLEVSPGAGNEPDLPDLVMSIAVAQDAEAGYYNLAFDLSVYDPKSETVAAPLQELGWLMGDRSAAWAVPHPSTSRRALSSSSIVANDSNRADITPPSSITKDHSVLGRRHSSTVGDGRALFRSPWIPSGLS